MRVIVYASRIYRKDGNHGRDQMEPFRKKGLSEKWGGSYDVWGYEHILTLTATYLILL